MNITVFRKVTQCIQYDWLTIYQTTGLNIPEDSKLRWEKSLQELIRQIHYLQLINSNTHATYSVNNTCEQWKDSMCPVSYADRKTAPSVVTD